MSRPSGHQRRQALVALRDTTYHELRAPLPRYPLSLLPAARDPVRLCVSSQTHRPRRTPARS